MELHALTVFIGDGGGGEGLNGGLALKLGHLGGRGTQETKGSHHDLQETRQARDEQSNGKCFKIAIHCCCCCCC